MLVGSKVDANHELHHLGSPRMRSVKEAIVRTIASYVISTGAKLSYQCIVISGHPASLARNTSATSLLEIGLAVSIGVSFVVCQ